MKNMMLVFLYALRPGSHSRFLLRLGHRSWHWFDRMYIVWLALCRGQESPSYGPK